MLDRRHTALMLVIVFFATFMDGLDGSIVGVALPTIGESVGVDTATSSWVTITYLMVLAGTLVAFARVASDIGVRKIICVGLAVFTAGSAVCGLSADFAMLIAGRVIQGVGAAMMGAAAPMCCTKHLPLSKLGFGMSVVTIGASLGFALGPAIGGAIVEYASWHWCFLINIPLGIAAAPLALKAIPASSEPHSGMTLDVSGTVVLCATIILGVFAIETLSYSGMRAVSIMTGLMAIALLALFVRIEAGKERPLLHLKMFRRLDFSAMFICLMLVNAAYMGMMYLFPFYGQIYLGKPTLEIGLFLLESATVTALFGMPMARWSDRKGRKPFCVAAGIIMTIAFACYGIFGENMTDAELVVILFMKGFVWALVGGPMASRMIEHATDRDLASSLTNEAYYIGGAIGTAFFAMTFTLFSGTEGVDIMDVARMDFLDGFIPSAYLCALMGFAILVLSVLIKDRKKSGEL